ncbi:hypothetical protein BDF21DRAFT_459605 [Thamnidium elegans]|uniref:Secreted protein n=1 Tax=Thamnidium elegans TaxID=101142 RepID=A0A8H7VWT2_9FUNG|nr:hypothetical protein INT48_003678 [Thamnidium elegans]KAI8091937.1 hypothetical protein BDF21DRAFT_459605 [Thamnidium elegans]
MKLSVEVSVALVIATLAAIDCRPVGLVSSVSSIPAISSSINYSKSQSSYSSQPTAVLEILRDITAPFIDAPFIELIPLGDSDPIVEVPIKEPVTNPVQDEATNPQLVRAVKPSAFGTCKFANDIKCKAFRATGAFACSSTSIGVVCSTRNGSSCSNKAFDACFDFTQSAGIYCSVAGCAQNL